jgi:hypothetical protein
MAGLNIGDVMMRVLADMDGFEADVTKKATAAGDKAGATMGQRLKRGMTVGLGAVGAGAGLLFGVAARGAAELSDAMARFQAETGATAEELKSARKSVLELSKTNLQSFDEIAATQAALRTDLGLTQEQAEANTDAFLKYGTATGRDAAEGVRALDDITDAWNLNAEDSQDIIDKLVASHQKYGGSLTENEAALSKLAPQLQALNLDVDDGIGLLNLFAASGLDAGKAQFALNSAIQKLPPGETLDQFIARLSTVEDDGERARMAIEVFGARGGAGLANAIRPGIDSLDAFKISQEQAAGATERAAEAIENTPLNQLKMALRSIAAPAIEAGQSFGPLIMALSQLGGGKLVAAVTSGLGGLAGVLSSKIFGRKMVDSVSTGLAEAVTAGTAESSAAGTAAKAGGSRMGKLFGLAFGVAALAAIGLALAQLGDAQIEQQAKPEISRLTEAAVTDGTKEGLEKAISNLQHIAHNAGRANPTYGAWVEAQIPALQAKLDALNGTVKDSVGNLGPALGSRLAQGASATADGAEAMAAPIPGEVEKAKNEAIVIGSRTPGELAAAILEKQGVVGAAAAALKAQMQSELTPAQSAVRNIGFLTSKEFGQGINDGRSGVRHLAEQLRTTGETELRKFIAGGGKVGKQAMDALNAGLKSKNPAVRAEAQRIKRIIEGGVKPNAKPAGVKAGKDVVSGLNSQSGPVGTAARRLGMRVATYVLKGVTFKVNTDVNKGTRGPVRAAGGPVEPGTTYRVNETGNEYFQPEVRGRILSASDTRALLSQPMPPGNITNVNLSTYGQPMYAPTPSQIARAVTRVGTMGLLTPPQPKSWRVR